MTPERWAHIREILEAVWTNLRSGDRRYWTPPARTIQTRERALRQMPAAQRNLGDLQFEIRKIPSRRGASARQSARRPNPLPQLVEEVLPEGAGDVDNQAIAPAPYRAAPLSPH